MNYMLFWVTSHLGRVVICDSFEVTLEWSAPEFEMQMCLSPGKWPPPFNKTWVILLQMQLFSLATTSLWCSGWAGKSLALCWTFPTWPAAVAFALMVRTQRHCWLFHSLSLVNWLNLQGCPGKGQNDLYSVEKQHNQRCGIIHNQQ